MKKLLISLVILTAFVTLPIKALSQRNDNWFKTTDDYENRASFNTGSTGLGNQGFNQTPQAPLGSGLLILTAIGAGYAVMRSRRTRKNVGLAMLALVMMLGLTQCKKNLPTVNSDSVYDGPTTFITLSLSSGDGSKVGVNLHYTTSSTEAPVTYESGDQIEVAYKGKWVGTLSYSGTSTTNDQNGNPLGKFSGQITVDAPATGTDPLYFYFLGNKAPTKADDGAYDKITVDISDQSNELPVISYAASKQPFEQGITDYTVEYNWLLNQCALVKFDCENIYDMSNNSNDNNANALYKTTQAITIYGMDNQVTVRLSQVGTDNHFNWAQTASDATAGAITMFRDPADTEGAYRYAIVHQGTYNITQGNLNVAFNRATDPCGYFGTYKLQGEVKLNDFFQSTSGSKDGETKQAKLDLVWHSGAISIGSGSYVVFSRGNVQYANLAAGTEGTDNYRPAGTWRFAKHQYDFVGGLDNDNTHQSNVVRDETGSSATMSNNEKIGQPDYDGWIDLFGWGTGNAPTETTTTNSWYWSTNGFHDWGVNNFVNSGKPGNTAWWTTLTHTEWANVLTRDKKNKVGLATITGSTYGKTVGYTNATDVPGLVILPDNFTNPYSWKAVSASGYAEYSDNTYTVAEWTNMEKAGAVFLPAAGWRNTDKKWRATMKWGSRNLEHGCYQSSSGIGVDAIYSPRFGTDWNVSDRLYEDYAMAPDNGHCVRLVHRLN